MELFLRFSGFWISKEFKDAGPSIYAALFYALNYNTICAIIFFFFFFFLLIYAMLIYGASRKLALSMKKIAGSFLTSFE